MKCLNKRKITKPSSNSQTTKNVPRKWRDSEIKELQKGLMRYGHKNFKQLQEILPDRTLDNIKCFMRTVYDTAGKLCQGHGNIDAWVNRCTGACLNETVWKDSLNIAKVIKYLSVDGLLENHPLPERCNGINFAEAYRLIYQALMGYPIQPVNKATCDFVSETLTELLVEVRSKSDVIEAVKSHLIQTISPKEKTIEPAKKTQNFEKPLKVYQRKKSKVVENDDQEPPSIKIVVAPSDAQQCDSSSTQTFSVTIESKEGKQESTVLSLAVPVGTQQKTYEEEEELLKSSSYNPFKLPQKWLQEPLYLNIQQSQ